MVELRRWPAIAALALLCGQFMVLGLVQAARDAPTVDEAVDLAAGLVAVEHRDARMNPEHGLLHHVVPAVLPAIFADPIVPQTAAYEDGDWFDYTDDLISANDASGDLERTLTWFRIAPLIAGAATGALLYVLGARLLNRLAGLVAAGLWLTTPYVLGLAHLSSLDVSFACAAAGVAVLLDRLRSSPTDGRVVALAAALGLALLVRHTAVVLIPLIVVVVVATRWSDGRRALLTGLGLTLLVPIAVVWGAYRGVDPEPVGGAAGERFDALVSTASSAGPVEALALAIPMPVEWKAGLGYLIVTSDARPAYLFGDTWTGSRPWFFPVSGAVKLPATVALTLLAGSIGWVRAAPEIRTRALVAVGSVAGVSALFLLVQPLNLGLRLALPVLALVCVLAAGVVRLPARVGGVVVVVVAVGQLAATIAAHPTSLAWTPPPFTDGYRFVSDSSIDFGQANRSLRDLHAEEPFVAASLLAPRGFDVLPGVPDVVDVAPDALVGRVAVSPTVLTVLRHEELSWLRAYCPVAVVDDAVLVYSFTEPPDTDPGPDVPAPPCDEEPSRRG